MRPPDKRNPAGKGGARKTHIQADHLGFPLNTTGSISAQGLSAPDTARYPIINAHGPFQSIGDAAGSFVERLGRRCIARAEADGDFVAAAKFRATLERVRGRERGAAA
jgi:hypothetical protein